MRFAFVFLFGITMANATEFYVRKDGSDSNNGLANTSGGAKLTIQSAANLATTALDIVSVSAGTYLQQIAPAASGTAGNPITFTTNNSVAGAVVVRGFLLDNDDYIRIIGFEITHDNNTLNYPGILLQNDCNGVEILGNYIHHTDEYTVEINNCTNGVIRGNRVEYPFSPPGGPATGDAALSFAFCHGWLIEYNRMNFVGDFLNSSGPRFIFRNNRLGPVQSTAIDFPDHPSEHHIDGSQNSANSPLALNEANYVTGSATDPCSDHHFILNQAPNSDGFITRGNVVIRNGAGAMAMRQADNHRHYQNSYMDGNFFSPTANSFHYTGEADGNPSTGNFSRLNIHVRVCDTLVYIAENGGSIDYDWDINHDSGTQTQVNGLTDTDPLFVNEAADNLRLQSGSPARNLAGFLTQANGAGTGSTTLIVDDATFFMDGWGVSGVLGDLIKIGSGVVVRISSISGNTITLAEARTWSDNDAVRWGNSPTAGSSDGGALPFSMTPLTAATHSGGTVTPTGDSRFVEQWRGGLLIASDNSSPYDGFTHQSGDGYRVYALYASDTPWLEAAEAGAAGDGIYRNKGRSSRSAGIIP